jgi:serine/threonine-protein phosphatase 2A catalytic subunit
MDTNMEDVKMPEPMQLSSAPTSEPATIPTLDGWIESLMTCKQLAESDVQRLCEKVCDMWLRKSCPIRVIY